MAKWFQKYYQNKMYQVPSSVIYMGFFDWGAISLEIRSSRVGTKFYFFVKALKLGNFFKNNGEN